jgi:phosphoribosylaminoimidazole-succinocarboxamide synthase
VRDVYDLGDRLLIVATDRISAFDVVIPTPIPDKGAILTQVSAFWFRTLGDVVTNHVISTDVGEFDAGLREHADQLRGRSMVVRKTEPLPVECVVRGYLAGSGFMDYKRTGAVCGVRLPEGLREAERLVEPIFTPATKAESGHDENISFERMEQIVGSDLAGRLRDVSLTLYGRAREFAEARGLILADTKFEFGRDGDELIWIDEALTPDSSRFWPQQGYAPGSSPVSFDKQFVRDYLEQIEWDKTPPAPELPEDVVTKTRDKYLEALRLLTDRDLE